MVNALLILAFWCAVSALGITIAFALRRKDQAALAAWDMQQITAPPVWRRAYTTGIAIPLATWFCTINFLDTSGRLNAGVALGVVGFLIGVLFSQPRKQRLTQPK